MSQLRDLALGSDTKNHGQRLMDLHVHFAWTSKILDRFDCVQSLETKTCNTQEGTVNTKCKCWPSIQTFSILEKTRSARMA